MESVARGVASASSRCVLRPSWPCPGSIRGSTQGVKGADRRRRTPVRHPLLSGLAQANHKASRSQSTQRLARRNLNAQPCLVATRGGAFAGGDSRPECRDRRLAPLENRLAFQDRLPEGPDRVTEAPESSPEGPESLPEGQDRFPEGLESFPEGQEGFVATLQGFGEPLRSFREAPLYRLRPFRLRGILPRF